MSDMTAESETAPYKRKNIAFYHVKSGSIMDIVCVLLGKILASDKKSVIRVSHQDMLATVDAALWNNAKDLFLPHALPDDDRADMHPIYCTTQMDNRNQSEFLLLLGNAPYHHDDDYERILLIFSEGNADDVGYARNLWKALHQNNDLTYWIQNDSGRWEQKL